MDLKSKREAERRAKALREKLEPVLRRNDLDDADELLTELEQLDPEGHRWPHKHGDILRRLVRIRDAVKCYERAAKLYMQQGFLPRAIAMAKVIAELDPARIDLLARIDPTADAPADPDAQREACLPLLPLFAQGSAPPAGARVGAGALNQRGRGHPSRRSRGCFVRHRRGSGPRARAGPCAGQLAEARCGRHARGSLPALERAAARGRG